MAYATAQAAKNVTGGGATLVNASYTSLPTVGHLLIIDVSSSGPSSIASSITDNQTGNTYSQAGTASTSALSNSIQTFYSVVVGATGTFTVTAHFGGTSVGCSITISEYSGNAASPFDKQAVATGSSSAPAVASTTPTNANSLIHSAMTDDAGDGVTITAGTNFTIQTTQLTSSTLQRIGTEHWIQTTATATTGAFALGSSSGWAAKTSVFAPLAAASTVKQLGALGVG